MTTPNVVRSPRALLLVFSVAIAVAATAASIWLAIERSELQRQVLQTTSTLASIQSKLATTEQSLQEKTQALAERDVALAERDAALIEARKPDLPLRVAFRAAWTGAGKVAQIRNTSSRAISVMAHFVDPRVNQEKTFTLTIDPALVTEIGHGEGWPISPGQTLTLSANGYKSLQLITD